MRRSNLLYLAGMLVIALGLMGVPKAGWAAYGDYLSTISAGSLNQPAKVAVDQANGDVYVTDAGNKVVKKYDKNGNYISGFSLSVSGTPVGIAVNSTNIFVGDSTNKCVWIYNKSGALTDLTMTGSSHKLGGASGVSVRMPNTITIAPSGHLFVVDGDNDRVNVYDSLGSAYQLPGAHNTYFGTSGSGLSSGSNIYVYYPTGIAWAGSPTISNGIVTQYFYLGDQGNNRVQKLFYCYNDTTKVITTAPTFVQWVGIVDGSYIAKGDSFGKYLRLSDLTLDNTGRLSVVDSLQSVSQIFQNDAVMGAGAAYNYAAGAVQGHLNIPTGSAVDSVNQKLYIANNQGSGISVFSTQDGSIPSISVTSPATAVTPCTANYTVDFTGTDTDGDGTSETVKLYYFNTATPAVKILFSTQTVPVTTGAFNGSASLDLVGTYPNYMMAGTYGIYAEVFDTTNNNSNATAAGTVGITLVAGKTKYTCSMQAAWDPLNTGTVDTDGDGLTDIDEIEGTFNTAYGNAMTSPMDADADHDGLDDGVEEMVRTLSQNTAIPLTGGLLAAATNPNSPDTDAGGASDAVEIAKGINPVAGADDLVVASSPQDLVSDYVIDQLNSGTNGIAYSSIALNNPGASTMVVDLAFYNINGTLNKTIPAAYTLQPKGAVRFSPFLQYGIIEGSLEVRASNAAVRGNIVRYNSDYVDPKNYGMGGAGQLQLPSDLATTKLSACYADNVSRYATELYVKNWSDTSANVTVNIYNSSNGNPGSQSIVIGGHQVAKIKPTAIANIVAGSVVITSDVPVTASHYIQRANSTDTGKWDLACIYKYDSAATTTSYGAWVDYASWRYANFIYMNNPSDTETISVTCNLYDMTTGNLALTKTVSLAPHTYVNFRPSTEVPPATSGVGTYVMTGTGPFLGASYVQRWNATVGSSLMDWAYFLSNFQGMGTSTTEKYCANYRDYVVANPKVDDQRYCTWSYMYNPDPVNTVNATVTYYNPDGSQAGTPVSKTVGPNRLINWRPKVNDGAPVEGSYKIVTDIPFTGFIMGQEWNYNDINLFDFGYAIPYFDKP